MKSKILRYIIWLTTTILLLVPIILLVVQLVNGYQVKIITKVFIILGQIFSIVLSFAFEKALDKEVFVKGKKATLIELKPPQRKNITQLARDELRFGLKIFVAVMVICFGLIGIFIKDICLMVILFSITGLAFMYADYIAHAVCYAQRYDAIFCGKEASPVRGLARIYLDEYRQTTFDKKADLYKNFGKFDEELKGKDIYSQDECIKNILRMYADGMEAPAIVYSVVLLGINILLLIPNMLESFVESVLYEWVNDYELVTVLCMIVLNIIFAVMNLLQIANCEKEYRDVKRICDVLLPKSNQKDRRIWRRELYNKERQAGKIRNHLIARGIYEFSSDYIDNHKQGHTLQSLDLRYRMLFIHKYYANIPRFDVTFLTLLLVELMIMIKMQIPYIYVGIGMTIGIFVGIILRVFFLPNIGRCRISKACKKLMEENTGEMSKCAKK